MVAVKLYDPTLRYRMPHREGGVAQVERWRVVGSALNRSVTCKHCRAPRMAARSSSTAKRLYEIFCLVIIEVAGLWAKTLPLRRPDLASGWMADVSDHCVRPPECSVTIALVRPSAEARRLVPAVAGKLFPAIASVDRKTHPCDSDSVENSLPSVYSRQQQKPFSWKAEQLRALGIELVRL
jgi:hypothetical protein